MNIEDRLLTKTAANGRSGKSMAPKGIVVHYVANPGSSALGNRNYFENGSGGAGVSAHYVIGLNGEILRCVPDNECAAHAGKSFGPKWDEMAKTNNSTMIGIECCHPTADGKFNSYTYDSLVELVADLCKRHNLNPINAVYRHYDVCGKQCPLFYVNKADEWNALKNKIKAQYEKITGKQAAPAAPAAPAPSAAAGNTPSAWAADAWVWAKNYNLNDGTRPKDQATREEVASFMYAFYNRIVKALL